MAGAELAPDLAGRLAESETLFRSLFDANIVGVLIADRDRVVEANDAFLEIVGRPRAELLAGALGWSQLSPPEALRATGEAATWEHDHVRPDGREVPILIGAAPVSRSPFRAVCFVIDLTERNRALERVKGLHGLSSALAAAVSADDVAAAILRHGMRATGATCAVLGFVARGDLVLAHRHRFGDAASAPPTLSVEADAPMPEAARTGELVLLDSRADWLERYPGMPPRGDFEAFAAVPLPGEKGAMGCMGLGFPDAQPLESGDVDLLQLIARQGAHALERAALYEHRSHVARTLQQGLLPNELPDIPGLQIAMAYEPQGAGDEVGGDFYDVFATEGGWAAAIGDVCGKGVEAAVVTGMVRHTLRALELGPGGASAVLERLNEAVRRHAPNDRFCSLALAHLTRQRAGFHVELACAGHPPPLLVRAGGGVELIGACGTLLGIDDDLRQEPVHCELQPGDSLVLYTDGITEARRDGRLFGLERLQAVAERHAGASGDVLTEAIQQAVTDFAPGRRLDDQALLILHAEA